MEKVSERCLAEMETDMDGEAKNYIYLEMIIIIVVSRSSCARNDQYTR